MATAKASGQQNANDWFHGQKAMFDEQLKMSAQMQEQWAGFLKEWQSIVSFKPDSAGTVPGAGSYQKFFTHAGEQYLDMLRKFQESAGMGKPADETAKDWASGLQNYFSGLFQPLDSAGGYQSFMHLGESMAKAGQAFAASFQQQGGPFAQNPKGLGAFDPFGFAASMPGIGYTREKQEAQAELYRRWAAFEKSVNKYNAAMSKVGIEATQKFQAYIFSPPKDAPPLTSLKSIYVKWVDICEEVYAKYAMTEEYTKQYGETVNALMSFKAQFNKLIDDAVSEYNLPTRQEIDSLHERLHTVRRENIQLKKDVAELKAAVFKTKPAPAAKPVKAAKPAKKGKKK